MISFLFGLLACFSAFFCSRYSLSLEIIALRQQLSVLKQNHPRPRLRILDRDAKFGADIIDLLEASGVKPKRTSFSSP